MRHDPASAALVIMLKSLKMTGMAQAISELTSPNRALRPSRQPFRFSPNCSRPRWPNARHDQSPISSSAPTRNFPGHPCAPPSG